MLIPFGKYKGMDTKEILKGDPSYLYWLIEQEFVPDKFKTLYEHLINLLNVRQETIELSSSIKAIVARVTEALQARGFTQGESEQMVNRLIMSGK